MGVSSYVILMISTFSDGAVYVYCEALNPDQNQETWDGFS